ncbi:hypothetical protein [Rhizobium sp. NZLR1]|uniref:hypothetical protein n=1 Tax=Rhizobium sp. NZLR1 TaxID=2731096 RepID=UPI001FEFFECA|nr:hypothetical protein [Rhizobium sp. NZLR1]
MKFLARLVRRREIGTVEDVKPDILAIGGPIEASAEESLNTADRTSDEKAQPRSQPEPSEEIGSDAQDTADTANAELVRAADLALFDGTDIAAAHRAPELDQTTESAPRKHGGRAKRPEAVAIISPASPVAPTFSDKARSLDEEIRVLRAQLTSKLQLQNAQLKKMLERFER